MDSKTDEMRNNLVDEIQALVEYLLQSGIKIPDELSPRIEELMSEEGKNKPLKSIISTYGEVSELIKPAIPRGIYTKRDSTLSKLKQSPSIVWQMLWISIGALVCLIAISASGGLTPENINSNPLEIKGASSYLPSLYILIAAALGASFFNLNSMYSYIVAGIYDPKYVSSYWVRLVLGIVAGYMIAQLVQLDINGIYDKTLLAILGGYSVEVVIWMLGRFIETLKTLIQGSQNLTAEKYQHALNTELAAYKIKNTASLSGKIIDAKAALKTQGATEQMLNELDKLLTSIVSSKN